MNLQRSRHLISIEDLDRPGIERILDRAESFAEVSGREIKIIPKLSPGEIQDEREIRDPKIRASIRKSHEEFLAGKSRPIQELFAGRAARATRRRRRKA